MDTFFSIFKTIGDCLLPLIGLFFSVYVASDWFKKRSKKMEAALIKSKRLPIICAAVGFLCLIFIISAIRSQTVQARQQSAPHQNQMQARHDAEQLSTDMRKFLTRWPTNSAEDSAFWKFDYLFAERLAGSVAALDKQGQHSPDLERDSKLMLKCADPSKFDAEAVRQISDILNTLAAGLPQ